MIYCGDILKLLSGWGFFVLFCFVFCGFVVTESINCCFKKTASLGEDQLDLIRDWADRGVSSSVSVKTGVGSCLLIPFGKRSGRVTMKSRLLHQHFEGRISVSCQAHNLCLFLLSKVMVLQDPSGQVVPLRLSVDLFAFIWAEAFVIIVRRGIDLQLATLPLLGVE